MDKYSIIIESALKYIKYVLKKAVLLILRLWYLIMLFFVILSSLIIVLISLVYFVNVATASVGIGSADIISGALFAFFINLFCVLGNIVVAVIAWFIDRFTFKTHIVFALVHAFCCLLVIVSAVLGLLL